METTLTISGAVQGDYAVGKTLTITGMSPGAMSDGVMVPGSHVSLTFLNPTADQVAAAKRGAIATVTVSIAPAPAAA